MQAAFTGVFVDPEWLTGGVQFTDELFIAAPIQRVWSLTEDVEGWPVLTPTMTSIEVTSAGPLGPGSTARVRQPRLAPATWTVREFEPPHRFVWETRLRGVRMVGGHEVEPAPVGCRNRLTLELSGRGSALFGRLAGTALQRTIATENDGFRRAAEGLERPAYVDTQRITIEAGADVTWRAVEQYAEGIATHPRPLLSRALGLQPDAGFAIAECVPGRLLSLAGRHRFSRYVLDLRATATGTGTEVAAVSYADFPGLHGLAYRTAVIGSRGHVIAVRRMLREIRSRAVIN